MSYTDLSVSGAPGFRSTIFGLKVFLINALVIAESGFRYIYSTETTILVTKTDRECQG